MTPARIRSRVVVLGAGLSGAAFALHLLRDHDPAADLTLVEPAAVLGAGVAYGTGDPAHRVNVAASRMSLFSESPDHFERWARDRDIPQVDPEAEMPDGRLYPQRAVFGRYVHDTLCAAAAASTGRMRHVRQRAATATPADGGFRIGLEDGTSLNADILVLGMSHASPELPGFLQDVADNTHLIADPWRPYALDTLPQSDDVLVVGTGLTGCDVVASLSARGHQGRVIAVSRRGLLPRPRTTQPVGAMGMFDAAPSRTALALLKRVREAVAAAGRLGRPWEDVIQALRDQARTVWGSLPAEERRRLLRHARPFWDTHRFQSAPQIDRVIQEWRLSGRLELLAATPLSAEWTGLFRVQLHPRGAPAATAITRQARWIVNCTGPGHRSIVVRHPVLRALNAAGALRADELALGIAVDPGSRVIRHDGRAWSNLFVVGPLARGTHGELMGLPQVSTQPREVAALIAGSLAVQTTQTGSPA